MRVFALTRPTADNDELMINRRGDLLCPAVDEILVQLVALGNSVVCVNVAAECRDYCAEQLALPPAGDRDCRTFGGQKLTGGISILSGTL